MGTVRTPRQVHAVDHRRASHPAVTTLAPSMVTSVVMMATGVWEHHDHAPDREPCRDRGEADSQIGNNINRFLFERVM
jgi:hypothetical protein